MEKVDLKLNEMFKNIRTSRNNVAESGKRTLASRNYEQNPYAVI